MLFKRNALTSSNGAHHGVETGTAAGAKSWNCLLTSNSNSGEEQDSTRTTLASKGNKNPSPAFECEFFRVNARFAEVPRGSNAWTLAGVMINALNGRKMICLHAKRRACARAGFCEKGPQL